MPVHTFIAESVADAVTQIRDTLGPEAVVLNVRRLPAEGFARLWQKPRIEVLAHVPENAAATPTPTAFPESAPLPETDAVQVSALAELRAEIQELRQKLSQQAQNAPQSSSFSPSFAKSDILRSNEENEHKTAGKFAKGDWRIGSLLEQTGLSQVNAERVVADLCAQFGTEAPVSLAEEIDLAKQVLAQHWNDIRPETTGVHVFVGAPGSGKTTALCKWLAQVSLVEGRSAAVWRLDGHVANTAESLSVFAEILNVPVERCTPANNEIPDVDCLFIDLPGVNPNDSAAMKQLQQRLATLPNAQIHLVVNGAYETSLLLAQIRAFSALPVRDVIVTHLDEENRWGKLWNLALGTNCSVQYLSAGQNIPGEFVPATAEQIFRHQFPQKSRSCAVNR